MAKGDLSPIIVLSICERIFLHANDQSFYGITIVMYLRFKEHNPPHIHAITQDFDAPFMIENGELMEGEFPPKAKALVKEFIQKYKTELLQMWETEQYKKLPPLD